MHRYIPALFAVVCRKALMYLYKHFILITEFSVQILVYGMSFGVRTYSQTITVSYLSEFHYTEMLNNQCTIQFVEISRIVIKFLH